MRKVIGLDVDGVLANFMQHFIDYVLKNHPDIDFPKHWTQWNSWVPSKDGGFFNETLMRVNSDEEFWLTIPPHDDAYVDFHVDYYVTARSVPSELTHQWIVDNGFPDAPVITVGDYMSKLPAIIREGINFFVDDKADTYHELVGSDINCLLMKRPHNKDSIIHKNIFGDEMAIDYVSQVPQRIKEWEIASKYKRMIKEHLK